MAELAAPTFERPHRTLGMRLYSAVGEALRRRDWKKPLDAERLIETAVRKTRLDDWGADDSFRDPLARVVAAYEDEARLTPFGRMMVRINLVQLLSNRLRIQRASQTNPEALQTPPRRPLFVLGLPRTGTTLLLNLLAQDPRSRPLWTHETLFPLGTRGAFGRTSDGRRKTKWVVRFLNHVAPQLPAVHSISPDGPEECTWLVANSFLSPAFALQGRIPSYTAWLAELDRAPRIRAYEYYRLQLQLLQAGQEFGHWTLKSPVHLGGLDALLTAFPDAAVVETHRDPAEVVPSACSLFAVTRGINSDAVEPGSLGPEMLSMLGQMLDRSEQARADHPGRIFDVRYEDLLRDPRAVVRDVYARFEIEYPEQMDERVSAWIARNPKHKHGAHKYTLAQFGLSPEDLEGPFGAYRQSFGLGSKAPASSSRA